MLKRPLRFLSVAELMFTGLIISNHPILAITMASDANFGLTDEHVVYELAAVLHFYLLDILGYGVYTSVYFVSLYLTCTCFA